MGLSLVDFQPDALIARIEQIGDRAIKHGIDLMEKEGEEIKKLAIKYAPIKDGDLHQSMRVERVAGSGINRRSTVEIFVDPDAQDEDGTQVLMYAYWMHEGLLPYGSGPLGGKGLDVYWRKASKAHDMAGGPVGGKFMTRALQAREKIIERKLKELWIRQFGSKGSRGGAL